MAHRKLPPDLQVRVHEYYEYKFKGKMFDEDVILDEMNDCLREVSKELKKGRFSSKTYANYQASCHGKVKKSRTHCSKQLQKVSFSTSN